MFRVLWEEESNAGLVASLNQPDNAPPPLPPPPSNVPKPAPSNVASVDTRFHNLATKVKLQLILKSKK